MNRKTAKQVYDVLSGKKFVFMNKEMAEQIYEVLSGKKFVNWFGDNGDWGKHIMADENCKTKDEILADIQKIFEKTDLHFR